MTPLEKVSLDGEAESYLAKKNRVTREVRKERECRLTRIERRVRALRRAVADGDQRRELAVLRELDRIFSRLYRLRAKG